MLRPPATGRTRSSRHTSRAVDPNTRRSHARTSAPTPTTTSPIQEPSTARTNVGPYECRPVPIAGPYRGFEPHPPGYDPPGRGDPACGSPWGNAVKNLLVQLRMDPESFTTTPRGAAETRGPRRRTIPLPGERTAPVAGRFPSSPTCTAPTTKTTHSLLHYLLVEHSPSPNGAQPRAAPADRLLSCSPRSRTTPPPHLFARRAARPAPDRRTCRLDPVERADPVRDPLRRRRRRTAAAARGDRHGAVRPLAARCRGRGRRSRGAARPSPDRHRPAPSARSGLDRPGRGRRTRDDRGGGQRVPSSTPTAPTTTPSSPRSTASGSSPSSARPSSRRSSAWSTQRRATRRVPS